MYIEAAVKPQSAVWHRWDRNPGTPALLTLGVWTEQRAGLGEDAEPLMVHHRRSGNGLLAVFDGAGGAGAAHVGRSHEGIERTGAWVGSRAARAATEEWFCTAAMHGRTHDPNSLRDHLTTRLVQIRPPRQRTIIGSMRRELPSTIAALDYRVSDNHLLWQVLWAGDSRSFLLDGDSGLQQLSRDDTYDDDALVQLTSDPPMTNMLSADCRFHINSAYGEAPLPSLLLCATDGFFGYVNTPAEFEYVLLDALVNSTDEKQWCELLVKSVSSYTGDDSSLALIAVGFHDFENMRAQFITRFRRLMYEHAEPVGRAVEKGRNAFVAAREDSWRHYRKSYEQRMPPWFDEG